VPISRSPYRHRSTWCEDAQRSNGMGGAPGLFCASRRTLVRESTCPRSAMEPGLLAISDEVLPDGMGFPSPGAATLRRPPKRMLTWSFGVAVWCPVLLVLAASFEASPVRLSSNDDGIPWPLLRRCWQSRYRGGSAELLTVPDRGLVDVDRGHGQDGILNRRVFANPSLPRCGRGHSTAPSKRAAPFAFDRCDDDGLNRPFGGLPA